MVQSLVHFAGESFSVYNAVLAIIRGKSLPPPPPIPTVNVNSHLCFHIVNPLKIFPFAVLIKY